MMTHHSPRFFDEIRQRGRLSATDIKFLQRMILPDGVLSDDHAVWLLSLRRVPGSEQAAFRSFVTQAVCDFVVYGQTPTGVVTDEQATWLLSVLGADDHRADPLAYDIVEAIVEEATRCSRQLTDYLTSHDAGPAMTSMVVIEASHRFALSA